MERIAVCPDLLARIEEFRQINIDFITTDKNVIDLDFENVKII